MRRRGKDGNSVPASVWENAVEFALDAGDPDELGTLPSDGPAPRRRSAHVDGVRHPSRGVTGTSRSHLDVDSVGCRPSLTGASGRVGRAGRNPARGGARRSSGRRRLAHRSGRQRDRHPVSPRTGRRADRRSGGAGRCRRRSSSLRRSRPRNRPEFEHHPLGRDDRGRVVADVDRGHSSPLSRMIVAASAAAPPRRTRSTYSCGPAVRRTPSRSNEPSNTPASRGSHPAPCSRRAGRRSDRVPDPRLRRRRHTFLPAELGQRRDPFGRGFGRNGVKWTRRREGRNHPEECLWSTTRRYPLEDRVFRRLRARPCVEEGVAVGQSGTAPRTRSR